MNRLMELRQFCESISPTEFPNITKFLLTSTEWEGVEAIASTLKHFAALSKRLQKETFSLSDFFGGWAKVKMEMSKLSSDTLAQNLLAQMRARESVLFNNSVLNAAVFLNPRYQQYMPAQNKENAIKFLANLHIRLKTIQSENVNNEQQADNHELNEFMSSMMYESGDRDERSETENETADLNVPAMLRSFIGVKAPTNTSVFDYWERNKHMWPILYELASVVHAVPPTQSTVERSFSAMALVFGPLRTRILDENLENSLLIRLNRELFMKNTPQ